MFQFEHFLIRNAQMYPDRLAFVYKDKSYTWSELNRAVNRLANSFTSIGLGKGDRVAYMFGNCAEVVLVFLATQKIGATAMPINTHFLSGEISRIMDVVDCKAVAYEARFSDTIHAAQAAYGKLSRMIVLGEPRADELDLASLIHGADDHEAQGALAADFIFDQIEKYHVTMMLMVPPLLYMRLYDSGLWKKYDTSSLREAQFTGGKCSMDYVHKIFTMFPNCKLRPSYGSTEVCASCSAVLSREEFERRPELCKTVGRINANCEMKLVDNDGKEVPVGEVGEGLVRSPAVFRGYIKNEELNARVLRDGWFHTEDLLRRDEEGFYYLVDRKKDMIKTGGENVYAQEVEDVLRNHPSIFDCALIGVDDDRFGEAVAAAIVLNPGCTLSDEELIAYCRANLPSYKKPRYVAFVDELPHNVTGKIQKSVLRENADKLFRPVRGL